MLRDRRPKQRLNPVLPSSGLLLSVRWFIPDDSGLPSGPIFKGLATQEEAA
jgi:hypothetical protein